MFHVGRKSRPNGSQTLKRIKLSSELFEPTPLLHFIKTRLQSHLTQQIPDFHFFSTFTPSFSLIESIFLFLLTLILHISHLLFLAFSTPQ